MRTIKNYVMDHIQEGERVLKKTDLVLLKEHLNFAGISGDSLAEFNILDIGCGPGISTITLAKLYPCSKVIGIDSSENRILQANQLKEKEEVSNVFFQVGDVYNLPFEDNHFDIIWSRFLFEYLKEPEDAMKELKRICKEGGRIAIADLDGNATFIYPFPLEMEQKMNKIMEIIARDGFNPYIGRKLYNIFYSLNFQNINVKITPYHVMYGKSARNFHESYDNWKAKIEIIKKNYGMRIKKELGSTQVLDQFLNAIFSPETMTYSIIFIVSGIK